MKKLRIFILLICLVIPLSFMGCENVGKNSLSVPTNFTIETNGIISFEMVKDAEYYTIMINDTTLNVFPNADENNQVERVDNYLKYDASRIFVLGESYEVKVKAQAEKKSSKYTQVVSYTHNVTIDKATNIKFNGTVLTWDAVEHANYYVIKVVAPYDKLSDDSAINVASSELTEYHFSTNRFDFSSLTTTAGEYKFYINAVSLENNRLESGFTSKVVYTHKVNLKTPINSGVYKINEYSTEKEQMVDNFHLLTVVDEFANAVNVKIDNIEKLVYLNGNDSNVKQNNEYLGISNVVDINLSSLFADSITLSEKVNISVALQSLYRTNEDKSYYIDSEYSNQTSIQNLGKLDTPSVELVQNQTTEEYQLTWQMDSLENVSGFMVYITMPNETQIVNVDINTFNFLLPESFVSASVQAIAKGNYLSSNLSLQASAFSEEDTSTKLTCNIYSTKITWNEIKDATYIVELNENVVVTTTPEVDITNITTAFDNFAITVVRDGYAPLRCEFDEQKIKKKLTTPNGLSFNTNSLYVLNFNGVENALGYYIYLNNSRIEKLFTNTTINLSQYITDGEYMVKVQAVANKYSIFSNSEMSYSTTVAHQRVLNKPEFILNDNNSPITKTTEGNQIKYILKFRGVSYADRYEILVNYNSISDTNTGAGEHSVDITNLITSAGRYTIMVRALPSASSTNIKPSEYNIFDNCIITEQLASVENVKVTMSEEKYTLSFETQANAAKYQVRILKLNDNNYMSYLESLGLSNTFETLGACDISAYVQQEGEYYIYVTALAPENSFYANSDESKAFAILNKLTTLKTPSGNLYQNASKTEYFVAWIGDSNADYFLVNVIDPNKISYEFKVLNIEANQILIDETQYIKCNINNSISLQGDYQIKIKALVDSSSTSAVTYTNSPYSDIDVFKYIFDQDFDYERNTIFINGNNYDYLISDINELKNVLWYNYLYEIDFSHKLRIMFDLEEYTSPINGEPIKESSKDMMIRLAENATQLGIYDFENDNDWQTVILQTGEATILKVLSEKLLNLYPELNSLSGLVVSRLSPNKFELYYENALNGTKVDNTSHVSEISDYNNSYTYLASASRRDSNVAFAIDSLTEIMYVTTTEQLLHAVQYGKRPVFVGDCAVAEEVYNNAKAVLRSIISNNMTELDKTTAIFDWINYAINMNYEANNYVSNGELVVGSETDITLYGNRKEYYLEGVFLGLKNELRGGFDNEFYLGNKAGTSESYSKAFTLLCAIEGIQTRKVNGYYSDGETETRHAWNKVNLQVSDSAERKWFVVDAVFSDVTSYKPTYSYAVGSHMFYLISENVDIENSNIRNTFYDLGSSAAGYPTQIKIIQNTNDPTSNLSNYLCDTNYNFYSNDKLEIKADEISFIARAKDVAYTKHFDVNENYNAYTTGNTLGLMQKYILNNLVYAYKELQKEESNNGVMIEFRFDHSANDGKSTLDYSTVFSVFNNSISYTSPKLKIVSNGVVNKQNLSSEYTTYIFILSLDK